MRPIVLIAGLAAVVALGGCTRVRTHQGYIFDKLVADSIAPGIDNRASVEASLGKPTFASQFGPDNWYYVSRDSRNLAYTKPRAVDQTILRVRFDAAGNVASVDRIGMAEVARLSPVGDKTPTLGRERSFFEDIFGNIGAVGAAGAGGAGGGGGPNGS